MTIKVLITEDHELYRDGLCLLVQEAFPDARIIEAGDFSSAMAHLALHQDLALMLLDIHLPGTRGLDGLQEIKASYPTLPLVAVSTVDQFASVQQMMQIGADGFIAKTSSKTTILKALKDVMSGEVVIISGQDDAEVVTLSPRQEATLQLLASGLSNKEIAAKLNIAPATVREYVSDLLALFDCVNRTQVVLKARRLGFILD